MEPSRHTYLQGGTQFADFQKAFMSIEKNLPLSTDVLARTSEEQQEYDTIYNHLNTETNCAQQSSRVVLSLLEIFYTLPRAPTKIDKDSMLNIHKPAEQESFKKPPWQVVSRPISQLVVHGNIQEHVPACRLVFPFHIFCCDLIELKNIVWGLLMVGFLCTTLGNGVRPRSGVSANHSTVCFSLILKTLEYAEDMLMFFNYVPWHWQSWWAWSFWYSNMRGSAILNFTSRTAGSIAQWWFIGLWWSMSIYIYTYIYTYKLSKLPKDIKGVRPSLTRRN